jgi:hypothetical protein
MSQFEPSISSSPSGEFVVVWSSDEQDGSLSAPGLFAQRFDSAGSRDGTEFQVNTYTPGAQFFPDVTVRDDGGFLVVWGSNGQDGSGQGVFARRFDGQAPVGRDFQVTVYTVGDQLSPVAAVADGRYLVAWNASRDGSGNGVFARAFDASGAPIGAEFQVNSYTLYEQIEIAISGADGQFFVVWASELAQDGSAEGVFAQRLTSAGGRIGTEFQVNSYTSGQQRAPAVGADGCRVVATWVSADGMGPGVLGVFGQRYDCNGVRLGGEFLVNTYTPAGQSDSAVSVAESGSFVVVWRSDGQDGDLDGIFGQRFASGGARTGSEFQINSFTATLQFGPDVAHTTDGGFAVVWTGSYQDGPSSGVFGQRFR